MIEQDNILRQTLLRHQSSPLTWRDACQGFPLDLTWRRVGSRAGKKKQNRSSCKWYVETMMVQMDGGAMLVPHSESRTG